MATYEPKKLNPYDGHKAMIYSDRIRQAIRGEVPNPVTITIDPSNTCNFDCPYCIFQNYRKDNLTMLSVDNINTIANNLQDVSFEGIEITGGGEPLTNLNLGYLLRKMNKLGKPIGLVTNGSLLDMEIANTIKENCKWIRVSLDAGSGDTHSKMHGLKIPLFEKTMKNIRNMCKNKPDGFIIGVTFLLSPHNYKEMERATLILKDMGVTYVSFRPAYTLYQNITECWDSGVFMKNCSDEINKTLDNIMKHENDNFRIFRTFNKYLFKRDYNRCYALIFNPVIQANMELTPCCELRGKFSFGKIGVDGTFKELWFNRKNRNLLLGGMDIKLCPMKCKMSHINQVINDCFIKNNYMREFI